MASMVLLMHYTRVLRCLRKEKHRMKHVHIADQTPTPTPEDAPLQQCHTVSLFIAHQEFHHRAQLQCGLHLQYIVAGHHKQAAEA